MERCNEDRPMHHGCKPPKCIGKFNEKFKIYEVCCRIVVKVCSVCGFEYEPQFHHICPRCRNHVPGSFGSGGFGPGNFGPGSFGPGGFGFGGFGPGGFVRPGGYGHKVKVMSELAEDEDADE
ncbi:hypothetical protein [Sporomusa sphaeroides]|uniref:Uncharacterized protein n=1 Tax=Sporomusa sphaeroides DSM 2875 TaxID=1337886 RepID=A0ABP2C8R8_9FIRM|nr:hypothetical protein [Sporomusa sphaeroides]OLS57576.1 hypothetical protein SPSPH_10920 [Sporomusa sphaeroides DSM 2875]CVK20728.1 hypothetical protein SSPH_03396 [Sporomusa sphaeroides DSM 2875]